MNGLKTIFTDVKATSIGPNYIAIISIGIMGAMVMIGLRCHYWHFHEFKAFNF